MVRFPLTIGLTGKAATKKKTIISQAGEFDPSFSSEVDNFISVFKVENIMLVPFTDRAGNLRGLIQFINKVGK